MYYSNKYLVQYAILLHKSDLQYFFSSSCFGMSIFFCYAVPISGASLSRKVLDQEIEISHEVSLGWKGSVSFLHATGQGGLTLTPNTKEDTLLVSRDTDKRLYFKLKLLCLIVSEGFLIPVHKVSWTGGNEDRHLRGRSSSI